MISTLVKAKSAVPGTNICVNPLWLSATLFLKELISDTAESQLWRGIFHLRLQAVCSAGVHCIVATAPTRMTRWHCKYRAGFMHLKALQLDQQKALRTVVGL